MKPTLATFLFLASVFTVHAQESLFSPSTTGHSSTSLSSGSVTNSASGSSSTGFITNSSPSASGSSSTGFVTNSAATSVAPSGTTSAQPTATFAPTHLTINSPTNGTTYATGNTVQINYNVAANSPSPYSIVCTLLNGTDQQQLSQNPNWFSTIPLFLQNNANTTGSLCSQFTLSSDLSGAYNINCAFSYPADTGSGIATELSPPISINVTPSSTTSNYAAMTAVACGTTSSGAVGVAVAGFWGILSSVVMGVAGIILL